MGSFSLYIECIRGPNEGMNKTLMCINQPPIICLCNCVCMCLTICVHECCRCMCRHARVGVSLCAYVCVFECPHVRPCLCVYVLATYWHHAPYKCEPLPWVWYVSRCVPFSRFSHSAQNQINITALDPPMAWKPGTLQRSWGIKYPLMGGSGLRGVGQDVCVKVIANTQ